MEPLVLITDDHADTREGYETYLRYIGARVAVAANGADAVRMAVELSPDVIVMDMRMPGLSGAETIQRLKSDQRTRQIPVIALSGQPDEGEADCELFLMKPCAPHQLASALRGLLPKTNLRFPTADLS